MVFLPNYQCPTSSKRSTFVEQKRLEMEKTIARLHSKHSPIQKPLILFLCQFGGLYIANKMETYPQKATNAAHKTESLVLSSKFEDKIRPPIIILGQFYLLNYFLLCLLSSILNSSDNTSSLVSLPWVILL